MLSEHILESMKLKPEPGLYRHKRLGTKCQVIDSGVNAETQQVMVICVCENGDVWLRSLINFITRYEKVELPKAHSGAVEASERVAGAYHQGSGI